MAPEIFNAADEQELEALSDAAAAAHEKALDDLREVLGTAAGRRVLWRVLEGCGVYQTSFSTDLAAMACNEGRRLVGLRLLSTINVADPRAYLDMMEEMSNER